MSSTMNAPVQHVFRGRGKRSTRIPPCEAIAPAAISIPTIADTVPITWIMSREVYCAREDLDVDDLVRIMTQRRIGSLPVVDHEGVPIGMVTNHDLVERLVAARASDTPLALVAGQLMMPLVFTLDEHATIAHAAALMHLEGIHHVPIVADTGCLIGLVSTFDIVRWLATNDGLTAATNSD